MSRGDPRQLPLPLPSRDARGRNDFFVSPANAAAVALVDDWQRWPEGRLALVGPEGSGKTHLVHVWRAASGAEVVAAADLSPELASGVAEDARIAVEEADRLAALAPGAREAAEAGLFHLWNLLRGRGRLLVTGRTAPARWDIRLPDLASRLSAMTPASIAAPDDALLSSVLDKLLADRQVPVGAGLVPYLVKRMERSFAAAEAVVATLDARSLGEGARVTPRFAGRVLGYSADEAAGGTAGEGAGGEAAGGDAEGADG